MYLKIFERVMVTYKMRKYFNKTISIVWGFALLEVEASSISESEASVSWGLRREGENWDSAQDPSTNCNQETVERNEEDCEGMWNSVC